MKEIAGAIFDMDGTLVDSMPAWREDAVRYLKKRGFEPEPGLGELMFTMNSRTSAEYLMSHYDLGLSLPEVMKGLAAEMTDFYTDEVELKDGALDLLTAFRDAGIPMVIVTSTDKRNTRIALERVGILPFFEALFNAGEIGLPKTEPEIFLQAAARMDAAPGRTWVFEDGLYAVRTAHGAGFPTVGVYDRVSEADQEDLKRESDIYVRSLTELRGVFAPAGAR